MAHLYMNNSVLYMPVPGLGWGDVGSTELRGRVISLVVLRPLPPLPPLRPQRRS